MAVMDQRELDFIASFARFSITEDDINSTTYEDGPFHKAFHLFPDLLPEIRNQIWDLTLPLPRVLHILPSKTPAVPGAPIEYITSPCSYGGKHPISLSVCRNSRGQALLRLTEKFKAFWDLKSDTAYIESTSRSGRQATRQIADMRKRGLWKGITKVALDQDIWGIVLPEHCIDLLRKSHEITDYYFICRSRNWHKDVVDPGVSWYLVNAMSPKQTEFKTHDEWCRVYMKYQGWMTGGVERDIEVNREEWEARPFQPKIQLMIIEDRKMKELPKDFEPPPIDWND